MNKLLLSLVVVVCATACSSAPDRKVMPDYYYPQIAKVIVEAAKCYDNDYLLPGTYVSFQNSIGYSVNSWIHDENKLKSTIQDAYSSIVVSNETCMANVRDVGLIIAKINAYKSNRQANADSQAQYWQRIADALNPPRIRTNCFTTGALTTCN